MRRTITGVLALAFLGLGCSPGAPAPAGQRVGVGRIFVDYLVTDPLGNTTGVGDFASGGSVAPTYTGGNLVSSFNGSLALPGGRAVTFALSAALGEQFSGTVTISGGPINHTFEHILVPVAFDGDGDASATASAAGWTVSWLVRTVPTAGLEPTYDALHGIESTYCQDAQQRLAGLDPSEVPLASIASTTHASRPDFAASKATLAPLSVHAWAEPAIVTTGGGNTVSVSRQISCKGRAADHIATTGVATAPNDLECRLLSQRSLDLAWDALTPMQQALFTSTGVTFTASPDVVSTSGVEWLTPIPDHVVTGISVAIVAHALLTRWNDPAFAIFPETIRGVHYCTTWAPAYAYWWYTVGAFQLVGP